MPENGYLPYKAINVFVERDYLNQILEETLMGKSKLSKKEQIQFANQLKHYVNVLGFRNPTIAPLPLQVRALRSAFVEKDEVIPFILSTWVKININFAEKVKTWLVKNQWKNLAYEREYQETEGFLISWPDDLTFDNIVKKYKKDHPEEDFDRNDLILMVIWLSGRLPREDSQL
jgi:hypothetical protein